MRWGIEARNGSWLKKDESGFGPAEEALSFDTKKEAEARESELCKSTSLMWFGPMVKELP